MAALKSGQLPALFPARVRFSLAVRLSLALAGAALLVFVTAFYYDYRESRRHVLVSVNETIAGLSGAIIGNLEGILADVTSVADDLAKAIKSGTDDAHLQAEAEDAILDSSYCSGATLVFGSEGEAGSPVGQRMLRCQYARSTKVVCNQTAAPTDPIPTAYPETAAWNVPVAQPDRDEPVAIYTRPVYRSQNGASVRIGWVSAELPLNYLTEVVARLRIFQHGYVFILSGDGRYLAHPDPAQAMDKNLLEQAHQDAALLQIGKRMTRGETGFAALHSLRSQQPIRLYFMPLPGTDWSVGIVFAEDELFADFETLAYEVLLIGAVGLLALVALVALIIRRMTRPLLVLTEKSVAIAGGDLDVAIPAPRTRDEIGILTRSFGEMRQALRQQLEMLAETRAAQARIESELKIARTIQASFLPDNPAALAASGGLEVATWFQPAREVGGDLFHCFWLPDGRLFLCIGDVAGKGVPAALMMAVTATLIKGMAAATPEPATLLEQVNNELCAINERLLFVTLFAAALNPKTGELTLSNAGHNPPLIRRADGRAEFITVTPGLVLGVEADWRYVPAREQLAPGDILLLYTDGVTEAMNVAFECFEPQRLLEVSQAADIVSPRQWVEQVVTAVAAHVGTAEQSDDLTLLAVARPPSMIAPTVESPPYVH
jgi:sigma-B regulation protein RsbU (phosphoserine phosphatase)